MPVNRTPQKPWRFLLIAALACMAPGIAQPSQNKTASHIVTRKAIVAPAGADGLCAQHSWACARSGGAQPPAEAAMKVAQRVNSTVNARVRAVSDQKQYGVEEVWALPTRRGGDCEDFVLLKKKNLIEAGLPPESLLIATVLDRRRNSHAVLVLRTEAGDYVLDNLNNRIIPWRDTGYSFIRMQNPTQPTSWVAVLAGGVFES